MLLIIVKIFKEVWYLDMVIVSWYACIYILEFVFSHFSQNNLEQISAILTDILYIMCHSCGNSKNNSRMSQLFSWAFHILFMNSAKPFSFPCMLLRCWRF